MFQENPATSGTLAKIHTVAGLISTFDALSRQELPGWADVQHAG